MGNFFSGNTSNYGQVPLFYDASDTPVTSPIAGAATAELLVPSKATRITLVSNGDAGATITLLTGEDEAAGSFTLPPGIPMTFDVAGMGNDFAPYPDIIEVVAGADSPVSFFFSSESPTGA